ncbi:MAG: hypothetical protein ACJ79O_00240 [Myxococcales bacterium]
MRRLVLLVPLFACASAPHTWSGRTLCEGAIDRNAPSVEPATWFALLVRGYDPRTGAVTTPAVDCTGTQVRWDAPAALCIDGAVTRTLLPARPLDARDLVVTSYAENIQLVWVMTARYAVGDALGPVAIVERKGGDLVVRAAGVLRAYRDRVKLRLEKVGRTEILVAEGERCARSDASTCQRGARLVPLHGDRFEPEAFVSDAGACVSPAWVDLSREESERLDFGRRRFQLAASLAFEPSLIRVDEEVVIHDSDPSKPATPPRLFRRAHADRTITVSDGKMVASGQSLWMKAVNAE